MAVNIEFENISSLDCKDRKSGRVQKKEYLDWKRLLRKLQVNVPFERHKFW